VGVLIEGAETQFTFTNCDITKTKTGAGVCVKDEGTATLTTCNVSENGDSNVDVSGKAHAVIAGGAVSQSAKGVGVKVMGQETSVEITEVAISGESLAGVVIANQAQCQITKCEISECGVCGIGVQSGATGALSENVIRDITKVGIQVDNGKPSIVKNEIKNCGTYGIHICVGAEPQVVENRFSGNGNLDVNRE
jgi:parallel beta-helix repeat protein